MFPWFNGSLLFVRVNDNAPTRLIPPGGGERKNAGKVQGFDSSSKMFIKFPRVGN